MKQAVLLLDAKTLFWLANKAMVSGAEAIELTIPENEEKGKEKPKYASEAALVYIEEAKKEEGSSHEE